MLDHPRAHIRMRHDGLEGGNDPSIHFRPQRYRWRRRIACVVHPNLMERDHATGAHVSRDGTDEDSRIRLMDKHVAADGEIEVIER